MKIGYISGMALYLSIISIVYITSLGAAKELPIYLGWPYIRGPYKWDALYLNKNKLFSLNELFATHNTCFVGSFSHFFYRTPHEQRLSFWGVKSSQPNSLFFLVSSLSASFHCLESYSFGEVGKNISFFCHAKFKACLNSFPGMRKKHFATVRNVVGIL